MSGVAASGLQWPLLPWNEWEATANTLHLWTQIVGKTRLALTPLQNHWWNVPLYVTAHGLGTSAMVCGDDVLDIEFDFLTHEMHLRLGSGKEHILALRPQTVADFYKEYLECLATLGVSVGFWPGNGGYGAASFYCYAAPVPEGLAEVKVRPEAAGWDKALGEFIFKYDALLKEASPEKALLEFLESSYAAAADVAKWDRAALERRGGLRGGGRAVGARET